MLRFMAYEFDNHYTKGLGKRQITLLPQSITLNSEDLK